MSAFCVARLSLPPELRAQHGIVPALAGPLFTDVHDTARALLADAEREAQRVQLQFQADTLAQAHALEQALAQQREHLLDQLRPLVVELASAMFLRLAGELPAARRLTALYTRLRQEVPRTLQQATLYVHPEQAALLPDCVWDVRTDAALRKDSCRLEAGEGEWKADFEAGMTALHAALGTMRPDPGH